LIDVVPTWTVEVVKLAESLLNVPIPNAVVPFIKEMVSPSGGTPASEAITAVKVTASPSADGFGEDESSRVRDQLRPNKERHFAGQRAARGGLSVFGSVALEIANPDIYLPSLVHDPNSASVY
jgi:hypothetical protein